MRYAVISMMLTLAGAATAQEVIDNSGDAIPSEQLEAAIGSVSGRLSDPLAAQFRNLFLSGSGLICGEVNGKSANGKVVGFVPFAYNAAEDRVIMLSDQPSAEGDDAALLMSQGGCTWSNGRFVEFPTAG
jgi:hypothetical protein